MRISWTKVESETEPPTRLGSVLLAEAGTGGALLVGGGTNEYSCLDTWRFDGQRWTQVCPQGTGPDVMDGVAAAVGDKVVMFGSSHRHYGFPTLARGTTWTWDGTQWHEDPARRGPRTRYHASMAYYPPEDSAVLFGRWFGLNADGRWFRGYLDLVSGRVARTASAGIAPSASWGNLVLGR